MTIQEARIALIAFTFGGALVHSAWSGDWSWFLFACAGFAGGVGLGIRAGLRDEARRRNES